MPHTQNFDSDDQALHTGFLLGHFMRHGVEARPVIDDDGNYTPHLLVKLDMEPDPLGKPVFIQIEIAVLS